MEKNEQSNQIRRQRPIVIENLEGLSGMGLRMQLNDILQSDQEGERQQNMGCPDCDTEVGEEHFAGCDVERCRCCGGQLISCGWRGCLGLSEPKARDYGFRVLWSGLYPGKSECRAYGLWCRRNPNGPGYIECKEGHPEATEDLNRLMADYKWSPEAGIYLNKPRTNRKPE